MHSVHLSRKSKKEQIMKRLCEFIESFFKKERSVDSNLFLRWGFRSLDFVVYVICFSVFPFELVLFKTPWQDTCFGLVQSDWEVGASECVSDFIDMRCGKD